MRKLLMTLFCVLVCSSFPLFAIIIETNHFREIKNHLKPKTLLVLDIDDTLVVAIQTLGTDVWFRHRHKALQTRMEPSAALHQALAEWEAIQHLTKVRAVEEETETIIKHLQEAQIPIIGLTTRRLDMVNCTLAQLSSLNIDLSKTAPAKEDLYFMNGHTVGHEVGHGVLHRQGILFTAGTPKGEALLKLLALFPTSFDRIVFINDKETHLAEVELTIPPTIEFIGLRYSHSDERVANYNPHIADIQWYFSSFDCLLSDREAELFLTLPDQEADQEVELSPDQKPELFLAPPEQILSY
jgi:hypothetical protein